MSFSPGMPSTPAISLRLWDRNGVNRVLPVFLPADDFPSKDENVVGPTTDATIR
jgi:hypothetical protein